MTFDRAALIAAFGILVLIVAGLGWQIERSINEIRELTCVSALSDEAMLAALIRGDNDIDEQNAERLIDQVQAEFHKKCPEFTAFPLEKEG